MSKLILLLPLLFSLKAFSESFSVNINQLGCHINSNVCFAYVDKEIPNTGNCNNNASLRWDGNSSLNNDKTYSTLLLAFASGKTITFGQEGCFSGYSTFSWLKINQ